MHREGLAKLGKSGYLRVDGVKFNRVELGGMLHSLSDPAMALAMVKYVGDTSSQPLLFYTAYLRVVDMANRNNWRIYQKNKSDEDKVQKGGEILRKITKIALFELVHGVVCPVCNGTMYVNVKPCIACDGRGRNKLAAIMMAKMIGRSEKQYHEVWKARYEAVLKNLTFWQADLELDLSKCLGREMQD